MNSAFISVYRKTDRNSLKEVKTTLNRYIFSNISYRLTEHWMFSETPPCDHFSLIRARSPVYSLVEKRPSMYLFTTTFLTSQTFFSSQSINQSINQSFNQSISCKLFRVRKWIFSRYVPTESFFIPRHRKAYCTKQHYPVNRRIPLLRPSFMDYPLSC